VPRSVLLDPVGAAVMFSEVDLKPLNKLLPGVDEAKRLVLVAGTSLLAAAEAVANGLLAVVGAADVSGFVLAPKPLKSEVVVLDSVVGALVPNPLKRLVEGAGVLAVPVSVLLLKRLKPGAGAGVVADSPWVVFEFLKMLLVGASVPDKFRPEAGARVLGVSLCVVAAAFWKSVPVVGAGVLKPEGVVVNAAGVEPKLNRLLCGCDVAVDAEFAKRPPLRVVAVFVAVVVAVVVVVAAATSFLALEPPNGLV
jgi:hypothetical protein